MLLQHESLAIAPQQLFHCLIVPFFLFPFGIKTKRDMDNQDRWLVSYQPPTGCRLKALHKFVLHNFVQHKLVCITFFHYLCTESWTQYIYSDSVSEWINSPKHIGTKIYDMANNHPPLVKKRHTVCLCIQKNDSLSQVNQTPLQGHRAT